jgi:hypothetical protein
MTSERGHFEKGKWITDPVSLHYWRYRMERDEPADDAMRQTV